MELKEADKTQKKSASKKLRIWRDPPTDPPSLFQPVDIPAVIDQLMVSPVFSGNVGSVRSFSQYFQTD